jgi:hypothetical protein
MTGRRPSEQAAVVRALTAGLVLSAAAVLAACSSAPIIDHIPAAIGGLPEGTPERPATPAPYPAVHDMPTSRGPTVYSEAEKKRLREELISTRERARQPPPPDPVGTN